MTVWHETVTVLTTEKMLICNPVKFVSSVVTSLINCHLTVVTSTVKKKIYAVCQWSKQEFKDCVTV